MSHKKPHPIDVVRQLLRVERVVGENIKQETVQATVTLPKKAIKVMEVIATLENVTSEVRDDGVLVKGTIHKQVFYVDEGDLVRHIPEDIPFRIFVDVEGARPSMRAQVRATIEDVSWTLQDFGLKLKQDVLVKVFAKVTETEQVEVVVDVPGVPVVTEHLRVESVVAETTERETLTPEVTLPMPAIKIFDIHAEIRNLTYEIKPDLVVIKGIVHKQVFYVDKGNVVRHFPEDVPFTLGVSVPGATKDMEAQVDVDAIVDSWELKGHHRHHGHGTVLRQTVIVEAFVKVVEPLQLDVVVDVPGYDVETMLLKVEEVVAHVKDTETVNADVTLPEDAIKVYTIMASIKDLEYDIRNGTVVVRGVIHKQIFYVDTGNLLRHFPEDVPFSIPVNVPGAEPGMTAHVRAHINGAVDWELKNSTTLLQSVLVSLDVKVTREVQMEVVTDVYGVGPHPPKPHPPKPHPPKPHPPKHYCPPGSELYIVKSGDTMFKIAKAYGIPLDALIAANPQIKDPNLIYPGDKLCIPTKPAVVCPVGTIPYTVQPGDSLYTIAKAFGVSLDALIKANPQIKDPDVIFPGDTVCVPKDKVGCPPGYIAYTVKPGDTLYTIAKAFGVSLDALIKANPQIKDPNVIYPGDIVCVPK